MKLKIKIKYAAFRPASQNAIMDITLAMMTLGTLVFFIHGSISLAQKAHPGSISSMSEFEALIKSSDYRDRFFASGNFMSIPDLDTVKAAEILIEGIALETEKPSTTYRDPRSYLTDSERLIGIMIFSLADLGPSVSQVLESNSKSKTGDVANWMIIALGFQKDKSVHARLGEIMLNYPNFNLRSMAARALYDYADSADIPLAKEALNDSYHVTIWGTSGKGTGPYDVSDVIYPVREDAASILREFGYFVRLKGDSVTVKKPGEWENYAPQDR